MVSDVQDLQDKVDVEEPTESACQVQTCDNFRTSHASILCSDPLWGLGRRLRCQLG